MNEDLYDLYVRQRRNPVEQQGQDWIITLDPQLGRVLTERDGRGFKGCVLPKK